MNIDNVQKKGLTGVQSGYCREIYKVNDQAVVNNYRCNQKFSTSNLWQIRRNKEEFVINTGITLN